MSPPTPLVLLAIVADGHEMTLRTLTTVLNIQGLLMGRVEDCFTIEMAVCKTINDALDSLHRDKRFEAAVIVRANAGFAPTFVTRAFDSGKDLVLGPAPLPVVDWDRVKREISAGTTEPPEFTGNVYNLQIDPPGDDEYARVKAVADVSVMFARRTVVDDIAKKFPLIVADKSAFALDGVSNGMFVPGIQNFVHMHSKDVWADVASPVVVAAPLQFTGSVGGRARLR
jgi:hypothetical protein